MALSALKKPLLTRKNLKKLKGTAVEFPVIAAPKYSVKVSADNWKLAEEMIDEISERVVTNITKAGGRGIVQKRETEGENNERSMTKLCGDK